MKEVPPLSSHNYCSRTPWYASDSCSAAPRASGPHFVIFKITPPPALLCLVSMNPASLVAHMGDTQPAWAQTAYFSSTKWDHGGCGAKLSTRVKEFPVLSSAAFVRFRISSGDRSCKNKFATLIIICGTYDHFYKSCIVYRMSKTGMVYAATRSSYLTYLAYPERPMT